VLALLLYVYSIYSTLVLYIGTQLFPPTYMKSLIWSCMMAAAATTLLLVLEVKQVNRAVLTVWCASLVGAQCALTPCKVGRGGKQALQASQPSWVWLLWVGVGASVA
jgi:hypothetical protein